MYILLYVFSVNFYLKIQTNLIFFVKVFFLKITRFLSFQLAVVEIIAFDQTNK